jgi:hypothetical protein
MMSARKTHSARRARLHRSSAMCGRYAITLPPEAVRAYFAYRETPNFPPRKKNQRL